jgi:dTDP-4-dehydrorhamnose reductase
MKILVTGAGGQLGREMVEICRNEGHNVIGLDRLELDITDWERVNQVFGALRPDAVVHTAAYTAVDRAEAEPEAAFRVNATGTRNIAVASERIGAKCCYISTDYVFDGRKREPYTEDDERNPQSVYGKSKAAGEQFVASLCSKGFIVRTSWVYGRFGSNFVKTMLRLAGEGKTIRVVRDQVGSPTHAADLSRFLAELIGTDCYGVYHASGGGSCTWYDFARAVFEETGLPANLESCLTEEYPRPAPRPVYSVLGATAMRSNGFRELPPWREGLRNFLLQYLPDRFE